MHRNMHWAYRVWLKMALRKKLSLLLVLITALPLLLTTAVTGYKSEEALSYLIFEKNKMYAERISLLLDNLLSEKTNMLKAAAATEEIRSMDPKRQSALLKRLASQDSDLRILIVTDNEGKPVCASDDKMDLNIDYNDREYYRQIMETGKTGVSTVLVGKYTGKAVVAVGEPIFDDRHMIIGVLIASVKLEEIIQRMGEITLAQGGYVFLTDRDGRILLHPKKELMENREDASEVPPVKKGMARETGWIKYNFAGQEKLAGYSYIPQTGWILVAQQPINEVMREVRSLRNMGLLVTVFVVCLAVYLGFRMANFLTKPILKMAAAVDELAEGKLPAAVELSSRDEVGKLGSAFNSMVSKLRRRESELRESEQKYRSLAENITCGIYRKGAGHDAIIEFANPALVQILGYASVEEFLKIPAKQHYRYAEDFTAIIREVEQKGRVQNKEIMMQRQDKTVIWCALSVIKYYDESKKMYWYDCVAEDITQRKLAEERLQQAYAEMEKIVEERTEKLTLLNEKLRALSITDSLTEVANRRYFDEILSREWTRAKREKQFISLLIIDVDFFKLYNDTFGHVAGDSCLRQIAAALKEAAKRPYDLVARFGGEEFAVILTNTDEAGATQVADAVLRCVRQKAISHTRSTVSDFVTVSIGVSSIIPMSGRAENNLILAADEALYAAKEAGRNRWKVYNQ